MHTHTITLGTLPGQQDRRYLIDIANGAEDSQAFALEDHPNGLVIKVPEQIQYISPSYYLGLLGAYLRDAQSIEACMERVTFHGDTTHFTSFIMALRRIVLHNTPDISTPRGLAAPRRPRSAFLRALIGNKHQKPAKAA